MIYNKSEANYENTSDERKAVIIKDRWDELFLQIASEVNPKTILTPSLKLESSTDLTFFVSNPSIVISTEVKQN